MAKKDHRGVEKCYALALALLFRPAGDGTTLRIEEHNLFTSAGVLTDDARWHCNSKPLLDGFVRVQGHSYVDGKQTMTLIAPEGSRFQMSMAQQLLFRMAYGFGVLESAVS